MSSTGDDLHFLVSEHQRELMAAADLESDLDLAFEMQMEEAMVASISTLPSSSSSLQKDSITPFPALELQKNDLSHVMKLQALELERFQQEKKDQEVCEAEMRRINYNLKLQVYDHKFAKEINQMPDEEWDDNGDNFEKPIDEGTSAGPAIDEPFRLYFKGLVATEDVEGKAVRLAAIGIAVCDFGDSLVLKIQKPLVGAGMSHGLAETKALIEGLHAVLSLDIKRIDVFFDYVPLYNHVTGRWAVKQRKIANLISQLDTLQRKFQTCDKFLLPRCHVKFAFKLAREAIDSQLMKTIKTHGDRNSKQSCSICLEETDASQMFSVDGCLHCYCFSCMKQHVEVKLLHGVVPGCPHDGCNVKLNVDSCRKFLSPRIIDIMIQRIKEASIPETDKLYCPYPKCSALMSRSEMMHPQQASCSAHPVNNQSGRRTCIKCNGLFCVHCKVPWHANMSCTNYKRFNPHPRFEDAVLQALARQKLWRQCVKCNHMIELAEGCFHMTCRCGYEFCYTCGAEWKNKKATCSCPLWEEGNIIHDVDEDSDGLEDDNEYYDFDEDYEPDEYGYFPRG